MKDIDPVSLRPEELIALVQQLRRQLTERDQEIEKLRRQLAKEEQAPAVEAIPQATSSAAAEEPDLGSQEDLLAQLEQMYPPK